MLIPFPVRRLRDHHSGFSLVELLIALVLVGVLASFLMSALGQMRARSSDVKCVHNLRQLANGAFSFAADNGGRLPYRGDWSHPYNQIPSMLPYLNLPMRPSTDPVQRYNSMLTCPAAQRGNTVTNQEHHRTYSINQYATGGERGTDAIVLTWINHVASRESPQLLSQVERASQQAFFMDGTAVYENGAYRYSAYQAPDRLAPVEGYPHTGWRTPYVHDGKINVVYLDGRVAPLSKEEALSDYVGPTNNSGGPRTKPFWGAKR